MHVAIAGGPVHGPVLSPTNEAYSELEQAYAHFNLELFDGSLPEVLLTFQRTGGVMGYFAAERFVHRGHGGRTHELALNPAYFALEPVEETMKTLVHEQVHLWQSISGDPGRRRYHNREWADKMESIGLMPSHTGRPGGRRIGESMAEYVIPGGRFEQSCKRLLSGHFRISWLDRFPARVLPTDRVPDRILQDRQATIDASLPQSVSEALVTPQPTRANRYQRKYSCAEHKVNVWGKPGMALLCGKCKSPLTEQ